MELLTSKPIPLEICVTSNVKTESIHRNGRSYMDHHFSDYYFMDYPISLCTDDKGVFCTSLTDEFCLVGSAFKLSKQQLWDISFKSIEHTFAPEETKKYLRQLFESKRKDLLQ